ncbi:MAG TPA: hypothetical protein VKE49_04220, partial [Myxococcaceae bacterium]|nr:hypothetical protein [Myxococcaceae bacterium]
MNKITHFPNTTQNAIVATFGPQCLETGEVSAIFELDGKRYGLFGSLEWVEELIKANGGGDPLTALEKSIREDLASIDAEAEREAEAEEETNEAAAVVRDILAGRLRPQQHKKSGKWRLNLGPTAIEVEPNAGTEELAYQAIEEFKGFGINLPRFDDGRLFTDEEIKRAEARLPKPEELPDPPADCAQPQPDSKAANRPDPTPESAPTSDDASEYGVFFPDADSAAKFKRYHELKRHRGRGDTPERFKQESPSTEPIRIISDSQLPEIELTKLTKSSGPLTKRLSLTSDGALVKDGSACVMTCGAAERVQVIGINALGTLIEELSPSQAIALGTLRAGLPNRVGIVTKQELLNGVARPDIIARTGANIIYRGPAFALLDYDSKGMPATVAVRLKQQGGFLDALLTVLPALKDTARLTRLSTSAGLSRADTGEALPGSDGIHLFVAVKDGGDSERFLTTLHERCWLSGFGWMVVSTSGALLERSIIDRMVGGPERLVFEGTPMLVPPLRQDKESRRPIAVDGAMLDTLAACGPLSIVEQARLDELKAKERERLAPEMAKARE